jgi:anti-sigma factor RsiW
MFNLMNDRDYELITAYIDGALTEAERQMLESRLSAEPNLRSELNSLRQTVTLLRQMPDLKAPRNFTLTAAQVEALPIARTTLPVPLTTAFSALSAAAAVLLFVFGGYFLLRTSVQMPTANLNTSTTMQQEAQQAAPTGIAFALTATSAPTSSPMPTMPPPTAMPEQAQTEGETAPAAAVAPPLEEAEDATTMMYAAEDGDISPEADDAETSAFRLAGTGTPSQTEGLMMDSVPADTAVGSGGAVMMATQVIQVPNPLMTDAALFATLGANFAQYGETPLPKMTVSAAPAVQNGADETQSEILLATATALPTATASPQLLELQATASDDFAEPTLERRDREQAAPDITGPLLLAVGGLLLVIAIVTTILRRRRNS